MSSIRIRRDQVPSSALPLANFSFAYASLSAALALLVLRPDVPGASFYHPRMVALVHVVTLAWLSGSILGAFTSLRRSRSVFRCWSDRPTWAIRLAAALLLSGVMIGALYIRHMMRAARDGCACSSEV